MTGTGNNKRLTSADFAFIFNRQRREPAALKKHINALRDMVITGQLNIDDIEGKVLSAILEYYDNKIARAANETGINRGRFYRNEEKCGNSSRINDG